MRHSEILRVGIIGTGFIARRAHIPAWQATAGARIVALCDVDQEALSLASQECKDAALFTDHAALLASEVDVVSVCTSNAAHFPVILAALEAGKHVLCEKPLGISTAEIGAVGAIAEARGLVLMAHHQLRFAGAALAAKASMESGRLGPVYHARVRALRRNRVPTLPGFTDLDLAGGGAVMDLGIHALDMALWLMNFPRATRVSGSIRTNFAHGDSIPGHWGEWDRARFSVEDFGAGFVHFENGATLTLECAWMGHAHEEGLDCELFGEKGSLRWPSGEFTSQQAVLVRETWSDPSVDSSPLTAHSAAIDAFYKAVTGDKRSPVPWREAMASITILEALYASARDAREIKLPF